MSEASAGAQLVALPGSCAVSRYAPGAVFLNSNCPLLPVTTSPAMPPLESTSRTEMPAASRRIEDVIASVDVALVDGCFDADGEIAGRAMKDIPHPFIAESLARFGPLPASERAKIHFTHLNHTNPAADPASAAARAVRAAGMHVLADGEIFGL